jgi:hypothetical protein
MRFFNLVTCVLFLLPLVASKQIFIDKSCSMRTGWSKYWNEAKRFAKEAYTRVQSETDEDFRVSINFIARHHYRKPCLPRINKHLESNLSWATLIEPFTECFYAQIW